MTRSTRAILAVTVAMVLAILPMTVNASGNPATAKCGNQGKHSLPKSSGGLNVVFSFGVTGGNIRPWNVSINLDGTVRSSGVTTTVQQLPDAKYVLKALLAVADAGGFFSMKSRNTCSGPLPNPDSGSHNIAVTTSAGTKRVSVFGSCKGNFNALYDLLGAAAGVSR